MQKSLVPVRSVFRRMIRVGRLLALCGIVGAGGPVDAQPLPSGQPERSDELSAPDVPDVGSATQALVPPQRVLNDPRWQPPQGPGDLAAAAVAYLPGWQRVEGPYENLLAADVSVREPLVVRGGVCYAVVAHGGTTDVDVDVWQGSERVAQDVEDDAWPVARWCATADSVVQVELRTWDAEGVIRWGLWADPADLVAVAGSGTELHNRLDGWLALAAPRWAIVGAPFEAFVSRPSLKTWEVLSSGPGYCDAWVAVGSVGVHDVDLRLVDPSGGVLDTDVSADPRALVQQCGSDVPLRLELAVPSGLGRVAVMQVRRARP